MLTQYAKNALDYIRSECKRSGKPYVDYPTLLNQSGISDPKLLERALLQLEEQHYIDRKLYPQCIVLIDN